MNEAPAKVEHLSFVAADNGAALAHLCGPLDENLEKISTSITEKTWLYNQYALNISLYYLHFLSYYLFLYIFS